MFVFIRGSIPPVRFGPGGTDPAEIPIPAVTYILTPENLSDIKLFFGITVNRDIL